MFRIWGLKLGFRVYGFRFGFGFWGLGVLVFRVFGLRVLGLRA